MTERICTASSTSVYPQRIAWQCFTITVEPAPSSNPADPETIDWQSLFAIVPDGNYVMNGGSGDSLESYRSRVPETRSEPGGHDWSRPFDRASRVSSSCHRLTEL